ncbi:MAG: hypothetical protein V4492_04205 [Chlamydiota bacterium]
MTTPVNPESNPNQGAPAPSSSPGDPPPGYAAANPIDPSGVWYKFFSKLYPNVTPQEVAQFEMGIMKWFSTIIAHENARMKKVYDDMKKVYEDS